VGCYFVRVPSMDTARDETDAGHVISSTELSIKYSWQRGMRHGRGAAK